MSNGLYNYYDPDYNPQVTEGNELLLHVNDNFFSFIILHSGNRKVLVWGENYPQTELQQPDELKQILNAKYDEVKLVVKSDSFAIVPKELYDDQQREAYRKFLNTEPGDSVLVNDLDAANNVVFNLSERLMKTIGNYASSKSIFFPGKVLITALNYAKPDEANLYAHIEKNRLQLVYIADTVLKFYNSYEFNNPDELMYYIVLVANELNINLDETSLILSGEVSISDKKIHRVSDLLAKVYLNQTQIVTLPLGFLPHQILLLSGLTLCESLVEN